MTMEHRTTDDKTGAQKGVKLERFDLVPVGPITDLARHYGMGASKYADRNWEKGMTWSKCYQAAMRHLTQFWNGEDYDADPFYDQFPEEVRPKHIIAAAWHCFALAQFMDQYQDGDDRPFWFHQELEEAQADRLAAKQAEDAEANGEDPEYNAAARALLTDFLEFGKNIEWAPDATIDDYIDAYLGADDTEAEADEAQAGTTDADLPAPVDSERPAGAPPAANPAPASAAAPNQPKPAAPATATAPVIDLGHHRHTVT